MKPAVFEIYQNGNIINQNSESKEYQEMFEKNILKLNFKSFSQIVILGSASFVPFMQLPAAHRREVIEDLLDIQIFSTMNTILKNRIHENKNDIAENDFLIKSLAEKIELHKKHVNSLKQNNDELVQQKRVKIAEYQQIPNPSSKSQNCRAREIDQQSLFRTLNPSSSFSHPAPSSQKYPPQTSRVI